MSDAEPAPADKANSVGDGAPAPRPGTHPSGSQYAAELPYPEELQALLDGKYLVESFLGQGGMGAVYKGLQLPLKRPVAIKILAKRGQGDDFAFEERFKREAYAMAALTHPHIVQVYDCGDAGENYLFISMELVEGGDLSEALKDRALTPEAALKLIPQICEGMQAAHERGIVHRDIKPANIFLTADSRAKVADFGLAKKLDAKSTFVTKTGLGMGTPDYAAPEQYEAVADIDHRADIYSLGVMMYQMLTGRLPRGAAFKTPSQLVQVDPRIDAVVAKAMAAEREDRYQSVLEIRQDLAAIMSSAQSVPRSTASAAVPQRHASPQKPVAMRATPPEQRAASHSTPGTRARKQSSPGMMVAVVLGVVVLAAVGWFMLSGGDASSKPAAATASASAPSVEPAVSIPPPARTPAVASPPKVAPAKSTAPVTPAVTQPTAPPSDKGSPPPEPRAIVTGSAAPQVMAAASTPEATASPSQATAPSAPSGSVAVPAWLAEARRIGGKVRFFGSGPNGATEKGRAEEFSDVVELAVRNHGWIARRSGDESHGVAWGKPTATKPSGATPFGPFPISRITHGATTSMLVSSDRSYRNIWGGSSQHRTDMVNEGNFATANIFDHLMTLDRDGKAMKAIKWGGQEWPPPDDLFTGAVAFAGLGKSYLVARTGAVVQRWQVFDKAVSNLPDHVRDVVEIHAVGTHAILRGSTGRVFVVDESGNAVGKPFGRVPADLGPAIAVRAGRGMSAAQMTDGTWIAWGDSQKLIDQTKAMGSALDVGFDYEPKDSSEFMIWVEASAPAASPSLAGAPPANDLAVRLGEIATQFQTAYDRDIAPGHNAAVADLDTKYLAAVNRALDAATKAGKTDESVSLREEAQRVTGKGRMPIADLDSVPESLKKLRDTYRPALAKLEQDRDTKAKPYYDRYLQLLDGYQQELTRQNRLDDALKVKARRDEIAKQAMPVSPEVADTTATPQPPAASPGMSAPATPQAPVKLPKGATVDSAIAWVCKAGGRMNVRAGGAMKRGISDPANLPKEPFEVVYIGDLGQGTEDLTNESLAMLTLLPSLEELVIRGKRFKVTTLSPLAQLPKLKQLIIATDDQGISEKEFAHLAALPLLETISVDLTDRTGESCEALRGLANLRDLKLYGDGRLSAKGVEAIVSLQQLTSLTLSNLDRASQSRLAPLAAMSNLEELHINQTSPTAELLGHVAQMPKLRRLSFAGAGIELDPKALAALKPADGHLIDIFVGYGDVLTDDGVRELVAALPNLEVFERKYTHRTTCTSNGLQELGKLPKLKKLSWSHAKDADCALLPGFPALEELTLQSKDITDAVFTHLKDIPKLRSVWLPGSAVTKAAIDQFKKDKPRVGVYLQ